MEEREVILKVENLSKQYRLGLVGTGTLSHDFNRWWHRIRGKEDPYLKIGETNDRSIKGESEYVWALRDINFEVRRGEVLGIIGKNGAGKSTLLKILSRVTSPTTGSIKTKGRIASLLEVGTGFHGEMTGRENIYLNGAILGMTKKEITAKIDEIIEFSGCERYIDTPVKRYSSGMTVRLAFAVAAFLEPEILIVDEVLSVGDAEFQKKAIGKMQDISSGEGRTVLFVSHNMASIRSLTSKAIVLEFGKIMFYSETNLAVDFYHNAQPKIHNLDFSQLKSKHIDVIDISITQNGAECDIFSRDDSIQLKVEFNKKSDDLIGLNFRIKDSNGNYLFTFGSLKKINNYQKKGKFLYSATIPKNIFNSGLYFVDFGSVSSNKFDFLEEDLIRIQVREEQNANGYYGRGKGALKIDVAWKSF